MQTIDESSLLYNKEAKKKTIYHGFGKGGLSQIMQLIEEEPKEPFEETPSCTVLIPVYNGLKHLKTLLPSLEDHTPRDVRILIINDCSTDPEVVPYIQSYLEKHENWSFLENGINLGFVSTINYGMSVVETEYAILLNGDTEVPENWINRMLYPFKFSSNVASTTPFTNSGVIFSFPDFLEDNQPVRSLQELDYAFLHLYPEEFGINETYSGMGFCMAISLRCWSEVGSLNSSLFEKGYGEENDWCFRALKAGWRHLLVPNLFVGHYHGGSFLAKEKKNLCEEHNEILKSLYPEYMNQALPNFYKEDPWEKYRNAAALLLCRENCCLYIDIKLPQNSISGAVAYTEKFLESLKREKNILIVRYAQSSKQWELVPYSVSTRMEIALDDFSDITQLFPFLDIKDVIVNNFAYCEGIEKAIETICQLKQRYSFSITYNFHDYLSVCPSFFLVNTDDIPCNPHNIEACQDCVRSSNRLAIYRYGIRQWRKMFKAFFSLVDQFIFFSYYSQDIVLSIYPEIKQRCSVIYHTSLMSPDASPFQQSIPNKKLHIAFVGNCCVEKGSRFFEGLVHTFMQNLVPVEFFLIGQNNTGHPMDSVCELGSYSRDNLGEILTENAVQLVVYPSINNETFSYVAQELMQLNVPLVVFSCGAPKERILQYEYKFGEVADNVTLESLCEATLRLIRKLYHSVWEKPELSKTVQFFDDLKLDYMAGEEEPFNPSEDRINISLKENLEQRPKSTVSLYFDMIQQPPCGLKEAVQIWLNKKFGFLYRKKASLIPSDTRMLGIKETIKIWIIKKMLK